MRIAGYDTHPAANLFPMLKGQELAALAADIKANGQRMPVMLLQESTGGPLLVLDGRNRLRACEMLGIRPEVEIRSIAGLECDPLDYVVGTNLHRRHLDASQRAMVAAGLKAMFEAEAHDRMVAGKPPANLQEGGGEAVEQAANLLNVSPRAVYQAQKVIRDAPAEVVEAVKAGKVSVSAAAKALPPPPPPETRRRGPRPARSGSASRIPSTIPKHARVSIPEFAAFLSYRFTSTDKARLGRLLLGMDDDGAADAA